MPNSPDGLERSHVGDGAHTDVRFDPALIREYPEPGPRERVPSSAWPPFIKAALGSCREADRRHFARRKQDRVHSGRNQADRAGIGRNFLLRPNNRLADAPYPSYCSALSFRPRIKRTTPATKMAMMPGIPAQATHRICSLFPRVLQLWAAPQSMTGHTSLSGRPSCIAPRAHARSGRGPWSE